MPEAKIPLLKHWPPEKLAGKKVLLRLDLNVPIVDGQPGDDFRIRKSLPTIELLRRAGARIILLSHLGRQAESLASVGDYLGKFFPVEFVARPEDLTQTLDDSAESDAVCLLENLRCFPGEEANDEEFAGRLAAVGDFYINDAFSASHRSHASIVGLPRLLPSCAGLLFAEEVENLSRVFAPAHPFNVILGGAKFETKLPVIERLINSADRIFVYGALAHAFFKEKGYELGESLVEKDTSLVKNFLNQSKIFLPSDVRVKNGDKVFIKTPDRLVAGDNILDVGLESIERLLPVVAESKFILWNGPLGFFEAGWRGSTEALAKLIVGSNAVSIVGGGDTVAAIRDLDLLNQFDFVSTAGGAMLEFLAKGTLPGIEALKNEIIDFSPIS